MIHQKLLLLHLNFICSHLHLEIVFPLIQKEQFHPNSSGTDARGASHRLSPSNPGQKALVFPKSPFKNCTSEAPELWLHKSGVYSSSQERSRGPAAPRIPSRTCHGHPAPLTCAQLSPPVPIPLLTCAQLVPPMPIPLSSPVRIPLSSPVSIPLSSPVPIPLLPCPSLSSPVQGCPAGWAPPPGTRLCGARGAWPGQAQGSARPRRLYAGPRAAPDRGEGCREAGGSAARPSWERKGRLDPLHLSQFAEPRWSDQPPGKKPAQEEAPSLLSCTSSVTPAGSLKRAHRRLTFCGQL